MHYSTVLVPKFGIAYIERFFSGADLAATAETYSNSGDRYSTSDDKWFGPDSWPNVLKKVTAGDQSYVGLAESVFDLLETGGIDLSMQTWQPARAGAFPVVPDYVAGIPECMRRKMVSSSDIAPVCLYVDVTASASVSTENMIKRGAACAALAIALAQHRPVELWAVVGLDARDNGKPAAYYCAIKLETSPLDLAQVAYVLGAPGISRRLAMQMAKKEGFAGGWPFQSVPTRTIGAARVALGLETDDILIPPILETDRSARNPITWIQGHLDKYKQEIQT